jgi:hypothetical protein
LSANLRPLARGEKGTWAEFCSSAIFLKVSEGSYMAGEQDRVPTVEESAGMAWWNGLTEGERANWLARAATAVPAEAWAEYRRSQRPDSNGEPRTPGRVGEAE